LTKAIKTGQVRRQQGSGKASGTRQELGLNLIKTDHIKTDDPETKDPKIDNLKTDERSKNDVTQDEEEKYAICETIVRAGAGGTADGSGYPGTDPSFNR
jgi:hypothetical protein